jgi:hypothetical protein
MHVLPLFLMLDHHHTTGELRKRYRGKELARLRGTASPCLIGKGYTGIAQ